MKSCQLIEQSRILFLGILGKRLITMEKNGLEAICAERKARRILKPSMFNRIVHSDEGLTLYNSAHGTEGIIRVSVDRAPQVENILSQRQVLNNNDNHIILKLMEKGYLVPGNYDEKAFRCNLQMEILTNNYLHLVVHVTRSCNFRCVYCYMDFEPVFLTAETQQGIINYINKNIQRYQGVLISWFGGEPLLGVDIIEKISEKVISICKRNHKPYSASITTNGYNLTPDVYNRLSHCRVKNYTITIDGIKELHDKQRVLANGEPTFDRIINNLLYIKNNCNNMLHRFNIRANITIDHYGTLKEYYDYLNEKFGEDMRFQFFTRRVGDYGGNRVKSMTQKLTDSLTYTYKLIGQCNMNAHCYSQFSELEVGGYTCVSKKSNKYTIGCYGEVSKCDEDIYMAPLGKLYSNGIMELDTLGIAEWTGIVPKCQQCDDCFLSCCCLMEQCPLRRYDAERVCRTDFEELDALIELAGKVLNVEII